MSADQLMVPNMVLRVHNQSLLVLHCRHTGTVCVANLETWHSVIRLNTAALALPLSLKMIYVADHVHCFT